MMKGMGNMTPWEFGNPQKRMPSEKFVQDLGDRILAELYKSGSSEIIADIVENIREVRLYHEVKAIVYALYNLGDQHQRALAQRETVQRELQQARNDAARIRAEAQADAQKIRAEAQQEVRRRQMQFNELIQRERAQIMDAAKRDAEAMRARMIEDARREAHEVYQELRDRFTPSAVTEAIDGYRREDSAAASALAEQHRNRVNAFEDARTQFSSGMTGLQAQLNEQLAEMQSRISRSMMDWREQLYQLETMDLAQCAVNLSTILAGIDKRICDAAIQGDERMVEALSAVRRNLSRFEKQYKNALNAVGLEVYQPQPGDAFDPARHVLGDAQRDVDPESPLIVAGCIRPGVLGSVGSSREAMIRAEVSAKEAPVAEQPPRPRFNQIVPGGDQG